MRSCRASRRPRVSGPQETCQRPSSISARPTYAPAPVVETLSHGGFPRLPPLALTSRTSKRSGSANGGRWGGSSRGEASSREAGVCRARAAWGRSQVKAWRQRSHGRWWARRVAAGGRVVAALSVRGLRSWRPFGCGGPGAMHAGRRPRRTHHAASRDRRARVVGAQGTPWSVRSRFGSPHAVHTRVNPGVAAGTRVEESAWPPSRKRLEPSATGSGSP